MLNENNELMTGVLTNQEFASWRGIKVNSLSRNKKRYLEDLSRFADFHLEGRRIIIDRVLEPKFIKKFEEIYQKTLEIIPQVINKNGYDNGTSINDKVFTRYAEARYPFTLRGIKELYPDRVKTWLVKDWESGDVRPMTDAERGVYKECFREFFGDAEDKTLLVEDMIAEGEISKEQAWDRYRRLLGLNKASYYEFLKTAGKRMGIAGILVKGFYVRISAF